jgi:PDZ domain-containing secreted protein
VPLPYYRFSPGTLYPTQAVISVTGVPSFHEDTGLINPTTVSSRRPPCSKRAWPGSTRPSSS